MAETLTEDGLRKCMAPRSDQLNADDLMAGPVTVTITGVRCETVTEDGKQHTKAIVDLEGYEGRPFKPCRTMTRLMGAILGPRPEKWVGERMTLYRDPEVKFKGDTVGGIRISHFSALTKPEEVTLTAQRGRKIQWVAAPLATLTPEEQAYVDGTRDDLAAAPSLEALEAAGKSLAKQSQAVRDALRPVYKARKEALES